MSRLPSGFLRSGSSPFHTSHFPQNVLQATPTKCGACHGAVSKNKGGLLIVCYEFPGHVVRHRRAPRCLGVHYKPIYGQPIFSGQTSTFQANDKFFTSCTVRTRDRPIPIRVCAKTRIVPLFMEVQKAMWTLHLGAPPFFAHRLLRRVARPRPCRMFRSFSVVRWPFFRLSSCKPVRVILSCFSLLHGGQSRVRLS